MWMIGANWIRWRSSWSLCKWIQNICPLTSKSSILTRPWNTSQVLWTKMQSWIFLGDSSMSKCQMCSIITTLWAHGLGTKNTTPAQTKNHQSCSKRIWKGQARQMCRNLAKLKKDLKLATRIFKVKTCLECVSMVAHNLARLAIDIEELLKVNGQTTPKTNSFL